MMMDIENMNPWKVDNLEEFLYYWCPECDDRHQSRDLFLQHALEKHHKAKACLLKFQVKQEILDEETVYYEEPNANDFNPEAEQHFIKVDPNEYLKYEPDEGVVDLPSYPDEDNSNEVDIKEKPAKKQSADYDRSDNLICNICYLLCIITSAFCKVEKEEEEEEVLGMFSHEMSIMAIFGQKCFTQKSQQKIDVFRHKIVQWPYILGHILN